MYIEPKKPLMYLNTPAGLRALNDFRLVPFLAPIYIFFIRFFWGDRIMKISLRADIIRPKVCVLNEKETWCISYYQASFIVQSKKFSMIFRGTISCGLILFIRFFRGDRIMKISVWEDSILP